MACKCKEQETRIKEADRTTEQLKVDLNNLKTAYDETKKKLIQVNARVVDLNNRHQNERTRMNEGIHRLEEKLQLLRKDINANLENNPDMGFRNAFKKKHAWFFQVVG